MAKNVMAVLLAVTIAWGSAAAGTGKWVTAYYSGWWQGGQLNPEEIDYGRVTHIIHFCLVVGADGTVNGAGNGITPASAASTVRAAHAGGRKILISVGGSNSDRGFAGSVSSSNQDKFIATLVQFMQGYGYDGIDVDWEPVESTSHYMEFIRKLRGAMSAAHPGSLLFTAVMTNTDGKLLAEAAQYFDQINLMTYDMSGPWPRWETWHNAPLYNGGARFQSTGGPLPSIDGVVREKIAAGVPASRLGIGIDFYGYRWWGGEGTSTGGVSRPRQPWRSAPFVKDNIPYFTLMDSYARYPLSWDSTAGAAYIGIDNPGSAQDEFISFDEERSIRAKAQYVQSMGLGGVIVYDLGGGYRRTLATPYRDILLQHVGYDFLGGKKPLADDVPPTISVMSPKEGGSVAGTYAFMADVKDNSSVAGVEFAIDGTPLSAPAQKSPYTVSVNTWKWRNGTHTLTVTAYDAFGNTATARRALSIANTGTAPVTPDRVVYDGTLRGPFVNTSWGATVDFNNTTVVSGGSHSAEVSFMAWGAFDLNCGTWGAEVPIDPADYDTLRAEVYPLASLKLKVAFYNGSATEVALREKEWNSVAVPLAFAKPFTRFYFQNGLAHPVKCYFANIRFTPKTYNATAAR